MPTAFVSFWTRVGAGEYGVTRYYGIRVGRWLAADHWAARTSCRGARRQLVRHL